MEVLFGWSVPKHYPTAHKILPKLTPHKFFSAGHNVDSNLNANYFKEPLRLEKSNF